MRPGQDLASPARKLDAHRRVVICLAGSSALPPKLEDSAIRDCGSFHAHNDFVTLRRLLIDLLSHEPRSASSLARELGIARGDIEDDLRHAIRSARAQGHDVQVIPARCKACGFLFGEEKLTKPSRCPACKGTRLYEPLVRVARPGS